MKIAANAADLDHPRIDGTRIYIHNLLKNFGLLDKQSRFLIYHKKNFNPQLKFPVFGNYEIINKYFPFWWTQTRFAWEIFQDKPDVLFMPMHSLPYFRPKKTRTVVTIHDLAFKFFPDHFPKKDLRRLNFFTDYAVSNADKLIAISNSTKKDILKLYPKIREEKVKVIYHGYNKNLFKPGIPKQEIERVISKFKIQNSKFILFVGTIQPRKNIDLLLDAFGILRRNKDFKDLGLVIAGSPGWLAENILRKINTTPGVLTTGKFRMEDLPPLIAGAQMLVLPSLYEGFGLPLLEAMACGTPIVAAENSSLAEIAGDAGLIFDTYSSQNLAKSLTAILKNDKLRASLCRIGLERAKKFDWEICTRETLDWITK